jgi:hypothetical protein
MFGRLLKNFIRRCVGIETDGAFWIISLWSQQPVPFTMSVQPGSSVSFVTVMPVVPSTRFFCRLNPCPWP